MRRIALSILAIFMWLICIAMAKAMLMESRPAHDWIVVGIFSLCCAGVSYIAVRYVLDEIS